MRVRQILRVIGIGALIAVVLVFKPGPAPGAPNASDPQVTPRPTPVPKDDKVLGTDNALDTKKPESVTDISGLVTLKSLAFTPPDGKPFKDWNGKYVDIHKYALASFQARVLTEGTDKIQVEVVETVSAIAWPLKCEGNLGGQGGGGGRGNQGFHWAAKSRYEKLYLFLWGYLENAYSEQEGEVAKFQPVVEKLKSMGYKVYDDGPSLNQADIDKAFEDEENAENPRKVIIDRNTTRADLVSYLQRGTVRGIVWISHGYMEPYPGCPETELLKFESRVWTALPGDPIHKESKMFVRDWTPLMNQQKYSPINFIVIHACASGGFGSNFTRDPWAHTEDATKLRVIEKYGALPPLGVGFSFVKFDDLLPYTEHIITCCGAGHWDLREINFSNLETWAKD